MNKYRVLLVVLAVLGIIACKKQVAGPKGEPGQSGSNGNGTQAHTISFSIAPSKWDSIDTGTEVIWRCSIGVPEISKTIVQNGDVKVYTMQDGNWFALPYFEGLYVTQTSYFEGFIKLENSNIHGQIPLRPAARNYRVVVFGPK